MTSEPHPRDDGLRQAAATIRALLDSGEETGRITTGASFGAARYVKLAASPITADAAPVAALRAALTAIIDQADPDLDDLRDRHQPDAREALLDFAHDIEAAVSGYLADDLVEDDLMEMRDQIRRCIAGWGDWSALKEPHA